MFHYVIRQLLAKLIFLVVLHKHPVRFVPALAPSALLWRELEHLPLSGTQVKLCLLWDEPASARAGSRVSQPLEISLLPWKLQSRSKAAPVSQKNPPWQKEERRHGHRCAPSSRCLPPAARMVPAAPAALTPSFAGLLLASAPAAAPSHTTQLHPSPFPNRNSSWHCRCFGDAALCPKSGCWLFAVFSALLIFSVKEKQSPCQKGREVSSGALFVHWKNEAVISLPPLRSAFNLVSTGRLKIRGGTRREGARQHVPGTVLLPRFLQNQ